MKKINLSKIGDDVLDEAIEIKEKQHKEFIDNQSINSGVRQEIIEDELSMPKKEVTIKGHIDDTPSHITIYKQGENMVSLIISPDLRYLDAFPIQKFRGDYAAFKKEMLDFFKKKDREV